MMMDLEFSTDFWSKENARNKIKLRKLIKNLVNRPANLFRINKLTKVLRLTMNFKLIFDEFNYYKIQNVY